MFLDKYIEEHIYTDNAKRELKETQRALQKANAEIKRLCEEVNAQNKCSHVGAWCEECKHVKHGDTFEVKKLPSIFDGTLYYQITDETIRYCGKHLHDICPEFEIKDE